MVQPFCCVTPHNGANIVIITQSIVTIILFGYSIFNIYLSTTIKNESDHSKYEKDDNDIKTPGIVMGVIWIVYCCTHLGLAMVLRKATKEVCISKCRTWLISSSILLLVHFLLLLIALFCLPYTPVGINLEYIHIPFMIIMAYLLWAVGVYIHEINQTRQETEECKPTQYA